MSESLSIIRKVGYVGDSLVIPLWFQQIALKKRAIPSKKRIFLYVFDSFSQFPPLIMPNRELLPSLLALF